MSTRKILPGSLRYEKRRSRNLQHALDCANKRADALEVKVAELLEENSALKAALRELMEFSPREYWDGVGDKLHKKTAGKSLLMTLDKCDAALRDDA